MVEKYQKIWLKYLSMPLPIIISKVKSIAIVIIMALKKSNHKAVTPFSFEVTAKCSTTQARVGRVNLPHQTVNTPVFMPVSNWLINDSQRRYRH